MPRRQFTPLDKRSTRPLSSDERSRPHTPGANSEAPNKNRGKGDNPTVQPHQGQAPRWEPFHWGYPYAYPPPPPPGPWVIPHHQWAEYYQQPPPPPQGRPTSEEVVKPSTSQDPPPPPPRKRRRRDPDPDKGEPSSHLEDPTDSQSESGDEGDDSGSNTDLPPSPRMR